MRRTMRLLPLAAMAALLLAGCAAPPGPEPETKTQASVVFVEDYALGNETIPQAELENATLGDEHVHDAWGDAEEIVLLDDTIAAGDCEGPQDAIFYAGLTTFEGNGPAYGCARLFLPEGIVVPEGTGELRVEIDATDALKSGSMQFQFRNKAREERLDASSEPTHTWTIPLAQEDWDVAHATATTFVMYVGAVGNGAVFEGSVLARIVAIRQAGWEPVPAIAHVDHWKLPSLHDFPAPGVMRLLDGEGTVTNIDPARLMGGDMPEAVPLADIIAPGARYLTIVADTTSTDCVPALECWYVPELVVGGYERTRFGELVHQEGQRLVYQWTVPDEVPEDSVYAEVSTTQIFGRINACAVGDAGATCGLASIASGSATARLQVFAWDRDVDLDQLKTLAS